MRRRVSSEWIRVQKEFAERFAAESVAIGYGATLPSDLYHVTDCGGLIGIFKSKTLWASLATSLNDWSETQYGLDLAKEVADGVAVQWLPIAALHDALQRQSWRVYVFSFCTQPDTALQWLHYGRAGLGAAIGFRSSAVEKPPFRLHPVLYDVDAQKTWLREIIMKAEAALGDSLASITDPEQRDLLGNIAIDLVATQIWAVVPRIKNPAFAAEDEWRLIAAVPKGQGIPRADDPAGETLFRTTGGRIVPYKKIVFDILPATSVTLGADSPMRRDQLALQVLMEETVGVLLPVSVSKVPVRP